MLGKNRVLQECTGGKEYNECGSACPGTCSEPFQSCTKQCVPGEYNMYSIMHSIVCVIMCIMRSQVAFVRREQLTWMEVVLD